jgi:putative transposase
MQYDPEKHHRRSIRLKGYDYSQDGMYFVTICARDRTCLFGEIVEGSARLNPFGEIVSHCWEALPDHYSTVELDGLVVMPNHIHGILFLGEGTGADKRHTLGEIVRGFKTFSAQRINEQREMPGTSVWQRGFYEHIVRSDRALERLRGYIWENPARWEMDRLHPDSPSPW